MEYPRNNNPYGFSQDTLRIVIQPLTIQTQNSIIASEQSIVVSADKEEPLSFIAPSTFQEDIVHDWSPYDSIGTKIAQKGTDTIKSADAFTHTKDTLLSNKGIGGSVVTKKLDTPLAYNDSNRRQFTFTFILMDQGNTKLDVWQPVRDLQKWSCAEKKNLVDYDLPKIFTVKSDPTGLLYIKYAALTSVQPTWYGPYREGFPSKCELSLSFRDLLPLYRSTFDENILG